MKWSISPQGDSVIPFSHTRFTDSYATNMLNVADSVSNFNTKGGSVNCRNIDYKAMQFQETRRTGGGVIWLQLIGSLFPWSLYLDISFTDNDRNHTEDKLCANHPCLAITLCCTHAFPLSLPPFRR